MKKIFYTLTALICAQISFAQITISSSPTINPGKVDSCNLPTAAALGSLLSLAPITNGSWDIGTIALQPAPFTYVYKAKTAGFPTATFSDSLAYSIGTSSGIGYNCWRNVQQASTGVKILGEEITKRQAKSLGPLTGNNLDSIIFSQQAVAFNTPLPIITFPATMSSSWAASTNRVVNFNVTVTAYSLNNAPGQHKQIRSHLDSVVGWGRVKVPIVGKGSSAWVPVLQIQHRDVAVDSYFVNGMAAPALLLTALGVSQGQSNTVSTTYFYRAGAYRALLEAVHSTPSHSSSVSKFYMHAIDLPEDAGIDNVSSMGDISIYPSPVRDGKLHVKISSNTASGWTYSLININGQQVARGSLSLNGSTTTTQIDLPQGLSAGIYYITFLNADKQASVLPLVIE